MMKKRIAVGLLVLNFDYYPRSKVNSKNTAGIKDGIKAGNKIPPIVAWKGRNWIADGFHRYYAYMQTMGADFALDVELVDYANEGEFFLDSVVRNSTHGQQLTTEDAARIVLLSDQIGLPRERLEGIHLLNRERLDKVASLRATMADDVITSEQMFNIDGVQNVALKSVAREFSGIELNQEQVNALAIANATPKLVLLRQVEAFLLAGMFSHQHSKTYSYIKNINALTARWLVEEERIRSENQTAKDQAG